MACGETAHNGIFLKRRNIPKAPRHDLTRKQHMAKSIKHIAYHRVTVKHVVFFLATGTILAAPTVPHIASAASAPCDAWGFINIKFTADCFSWIILNILYLPLYLAGWLLRFVAGFFDIAVNISIQNGAYDPGAIPVIGLGWGITRDVATMFLIFILLIIAIGIILRLERFGSKQILTYLIIVGLLINFSLPISQLVIDASNVLALTFYNGLAANAGASPAPAAVGGLFPAPAGIAGVFVEGLAPQKTLETGRTAPGTEILSADGGALVLKVLLNGIISMLMGIAIILTAAFVLGALGILFIIRMVVLWIIMILAPLAFIAMILPVTRSYATRWWRKLFEQSFFAPFALFFFYLVGKVIESGFLKNVFGVTGNTMVTDAAAMSVLVSNVRIIAKYIALIVLLIASLIVSKELSAYGATTALATGRKAGKSAQGAAGRAARRTALRAAGAVAGGVAATRAGRAVMNIVPGGRAGVQRAMSEGAEARDYRAKQEAERVKNLSPYDLARAAPTLTHEARARLFKGWRPEQREKYVAELEKRGELSSFVKSVTGVAKGGGGERYAGIEKDLAKSVAPHNAEEALKISNPDVFITTSGGEERLPEFEKGEAASERAQRAANDLFASLTPEQRAKITRGIGAADTNIGKRYREYITQQGKLNEFTADRETIKHTNRMLNQIAADYDVDVTVHMEEARKEAEFSNMKAAAESKGISTKVQVESPGRKIGEDKTHEELKRELEFAGAKVEVTNEEVEEIAKQKTLAKVQERLRGEGKGQFADQLSSNMGTQLFFSPKRVEIRGGEEKKESVTREDVEEMMESKKT